MTSLSDGWVKDTTDGAVAQEVGASSSMPSVGGRPKLPKSARTGNTPRSNFTKENYSFESFEYPKGVASTVEYGLNYVIFYLNVHEDSKLLVGNSAAVLSTDQPERLSGYVAKTDVNAKTITTVAGAVIGSQAGLTKKILGKAGIELTTKGNAIATGVEAAGGALVGNALGRFTKQKKFKRLKTCIALHIPTDLSIKYGVNYEEESMAGSQAINEIAGNLGGSVMDIGKALVTASGQGGAITDYASGVALGTPGIGKFLSKSSGMVANPKSEQLFKNVDFRTFTFSYQFHPRSSDEARSVQDIIKMFKLHMHPEFKSSSEFLYLVPSEFDISYYHGGVENKNLHRHTSCVLTDMNISYMPQGVVAMFPDGHPTQINVTLTFKELALLTKENIQDGY